ncbi:MAG: DUF2997 domain-containing protein [Gloeomargarita sp. DG02_4_bins_56]
METIEFVIRPDGRVEVQVQGIAGTECARVSHQIEQDLGQVTRREWTAEYFQTVAQSQDAHVRPHY